MLALIGWIAVRKIDGSRDYFVAGGTIPWWLGGISHHVSGHSGVVFVAYAAVAYQHGFTLYSSTQNPHYLHRQLARVLQLPASQIRVIACPNGGG